MKQVIWKYKLEMKDRQELKLPRGAKLLSAIDQRGKVVLYALVDPDPKVPKMVRIIKMFGTGNQCDFADFQGTFLGTVKLVSGGFVIHVFWF